MSISDINKGASGVNPTADSILPSQTGNSGKVLKTDGTNASWDDYSPPPATPATETVAGIALLPKPITIANNATDANNDIDFIAGNFQFSDGSGQAVTTALTKRLDASWTAGTNQGGLFSGSKANSTWYHCFAIYNPTTGASDCGFDTSVIATNRPAGYTKYKRVGSIRTVANGNILQFTQLNKNEFYYASDISETSSIGTPNTNNLLSITTPLGISTKAMITARLIATTSGVAYEYTIFSPIAQGNKGIIIGAGTQADATQVLQREICTDTSSRIYQNGSTYTSLSGGLFTTGYIDYTL